MQIDIASYVPSTSGPSYLLLMGIKDTSSIWGYTLNKRSEAKECIENWLKAHLKLIPRETRPTCLQTDNAKELDCSQLAAQHGLKYRRTGTYSPQQNGFIERALAEVEKITLALLIQANFPKDHWHYAARHAITVINRLPHPKLEWLTTLETTYMELGCGTTDLKVFGCLAAVQVPSTMRRKLKYERKLGTYIGNSSNSPDFIILLPEGRIIHSQHIFFHEHLRGVDYKSILSPLDGSYLPELQDTVISDDSVGDLHRMPPQINGETLLDHNKVYYQEDFEDEDNKLSKTLGMETTVTPAQYGCGAPDEMAQIQHNDPRYRVGPDQLGSLALLADNKSEGDVPNSPKDALKSKIWKASMEDEYEAHIKNGTWKLVKWQPGMNVIGSIWAYTIKKDHNGDPLRYKSRLCVQGFSQVYGVDYDETFSPVVDVNTIRLIVSFAAHHSLTIYQADVPTAYLNASVDKEIYMGQPSGFVVHPQDEGRLVCQLERAIYDLKQSGRRWWSLLHTFITDMGFIQSGTDMCFYYLKCCGHRTFLAIYVGDILIVGTSEEIRLNTLDLLRERFNI